MWSITGDSESPGKFYCHHARLVQMLIDYTQIAGVIEALLLKTHILQHEQVDELEDGELPDPNQKVRFGRLLVESIV
jgi:hypothetical protein